MHHNLAVSFLGRDCPGVVAAIASLMEDAHCNILAVSQTILEGEFAAIFTVQAKESLSSEALHVHLQQGLLQKQVDLSVIVRPAIEKAWGESLECEAFVITANGPNGPGLIAALSNVFARHNVNIENLKAITDADREGHALFVFEVMIPRHLDMRTLRRELREQGQRLSLQMSLQHRDIFEAMHRVSSL